MTDIYLRNANDFFEYLMPFNKVEVVFNGNAVSSSGDAYIFDLFDKTEVYDDIPIFSFVIDGNLIDEIVYVPVGNKYDFDYTQAHFSKMIKYIENNKNKLIGEDN